MDNLHWMIAAALVTTGCVDVIETNEGESFATTEAAPTYTAPGKSDGVYVQQPEDQPEPDGIDLIQPEAECDETSIIGDVDLRNDRIGPPVVTEVFGPAGCLEERWVREWDGELPLSEKYDVFVDFLPRYAYVDPVPYVHRWTYDAGGDIVREERRIGDELVFVESTRYDFVGNVVEVERTGYPRASTLGTHREITRFDAEGRKVRHDVYYEGEPSSAQKWVYDADGNLIEHWRGVGDDLGVQRRRTFVDGLLAGEELLNFRSGELRVETAYERRTDGTLERTVSRNHENGWLDVQTYDADERKLVYTQDSDLDGRIDYRLTNEWDRDGNRLSNRVEYDFDASGTPHVVSEKRWEYDERGRLVVGVDASSWRDVPRRTTRTYDGTGPGYDVVDEDLHPDGPVVVLESRWLDDDRMLWTRSDTDRDGLFENVTENVWDGERQLSTKTDYDGDGFPDSVQRWRYDAAGQLAEHVIDADGDGVIDARTTHRR